MSYDMSYGTLDEIKFVCMMVSNAIQLPNNYKCEKIKPIDKLSNYYEAIKKRSRWGSINKDIIIMAIDILKEKLLNNEDTMDYNNICKQASLKY